MIGYLSILNEMDDMLKKQQEKYMEQHQVTMTLKQQHRINHMNQMMI